MKQYSRMGVYHQTGYYHNKKPVWSRHDGTRKMFYSDSVFPFTEMTGITCIDITVGHWMIGNDPATNAGGVSTVVFNTNLLPDQISEWEYYDNDGKWYTDPLLTVTGNIVILRSLY